MEEGSEIRHLHLLPVSFEERGVEAQLQYLYVNRKAVDKSFIINFLLRLSESTDLVGVAIKCLQSLASLFNLAAESATGELTLLASNLQDMSQSFDPPMAGMQELHTEYTNFWRPNPVCCKKDGRRPSVRNVILSELSHRFPEQVILFSLTCSVPAIDLSMCSSSDVMGTSIMTQRQPSLQVTVGFIPHIVIEEQLESYATEIVGDNPERIDDVSMQQVAETAISNAINCFSSQPELTNYVRLWRSKHGGAAFVVQKRSFDIAGRPRTQCWYRWAKNSMLVHETKCKEKTIE
jgi:hypothetical protein